MKVFLSFSGKRSHAVAEAFHNWLPQVIQEVTPYMSAKDIDKGARWAGEISAALEESNFGIICVTGDNLTKPWLQFEAGALSKKVDRARVTPFLFDVDPVQLEYPLALFQATRNTESDIRELVFSINRWCATPLDEARLANSFGHWWSDLKEKLDGIAKNPDLALAETPGLVSTEVMLTRILEAVQGQQRVVADLTARQTQYQIDPMYRITTMLAQRPRVRMTFASPEHVQEWLDKPADPGEFETSGLRDAARRFLDGIAAKNPKGQISGIRFLLEDNDTITIVYDEQ